jgi:hypothetical protein
LRAAFVTVPLRRIHVISSRADADTAEVCVNILCNVQANAELQTNRLRAMDDSTTAEGSPIDAASPDPIVQQAFSLASGDVYRASSGSIRVVPLTWGSSPVPSFLHVRLTLPSRITTPHPAPAANALPCHFAVASPCCYRHRRTLCLQATAFSKSRLLHRFSRLSSRYCTAEARLS